MDIDTRDGTVWGEAVAVALEHLAESQGGAGELHPIDVYQMIYRLENIVGIHHDGCRGCKRLTAALNGGPGARPDAMAGNLKAGAELIADIVARSQVGRVNSNHLYRLRGVGTNLDAYANTIRACLNTEDHS